MPSKETTGGGWGFKVHAPVFYPAVALILGFVALTLIFKSSVGVFFSGAVAAMNQYAGWFLTATVNIVLGYVIYLALSKYAHIRIGGPKAKPEFSRLSWYAMLFSAGLGIGLLYFGVAEPITHFTNPPYAEPGTSHAAKVAMGVTFLHWGFHGWGIYALVGLALAFATFNRGLPLTIRTALYPLLGERIYGRIGDFVDVSATVATLFGVAVSLGLGTLQVNAGLNYLLGVPEAPWVQFLLICFITACATISVVLGLKGGVRRASEINIMLATVLLLFVLVLGPTAFVLDSLLENVGYYVANFVSLATWNETYRNGTWQNDWTLFYWAWWIAWGPFVGMFIGRISKGRTVREFIVGVLLVPVAVTFLWMSVFGSAAIWIEMYGGGGIAAAVSDNPASGIFAFLEHLPLPMVSSLWTLVVVVLFFVTSSDSGSMVIDIITSGGDLDPPIPQRVFWATLEGGVAAALLFGGGLLALQAATVAAGLPFAGIILMMVWSLRTGLKEHLEEERAQIRGETAS